MRTKLFQAYDEKRDRIKYAVQILIEYEDGSQGWVLLSSGGKVQWHDTVQSAEYERGVLRKKPMWRGVKKAEPATATT
jgi:hypothetical protein